MTETTFTEMTFEAAFARLPLIAILRGLTAPEAPAIGAALVDAGFCLIETPLNSPEPLKSIAALRTRVGAHALIGAGTVLSAAQVAEIAGAGAKFVVAPNTDPAVISAARARDLPALPGAATASEMFAALAAGAAAVKLFPGEMISPLVVKALRAVAPIGAKLIPVGGVDAGNVRAYRAAGADGIGFGGALYTPGQSPDETSRRARALVAAWHAGG